MTRREGWSDEGDMATAVAPRMRFPDQGKQAMAMDRLTMEALSPRVRVIGEERDGGPWFLIRERGSLGQEGEGVLQAQKRARAAAMGLVSPHSLRKWEADEGRLKNCVFQGARGEL